MIKMDLKKMAELQKKSYEEAEMMLPKPLHKCPSKCPKCGELL